MRSLLPCLLAFSLVGCEDIGTFDCDAMASLSVLVTLTDDAGAPITGALLTVTDDSGNVQDCHEYEGSYECGWELIGDLSISAEADGFQSDALDVTVESDGCHAITEDVSLALSPAD